MSFSLLQPMSNENESSDCQQNSVDTLRASFETSAIFAEDVGEQCSSSLIQTSETTVEDVCEEVLGSKMAALELNSTKQIPGYGDGSDSGVDIANCLTLGLQRALSSNSGGYASSNGGLDESNVNGNISCDSSMISYSSDIGESHKTVNTVLGPNSNYECTSENGSESSSIAGGPTVRKQNVVKKKVGLPEPSCLPKSTSFRKPSGDIMTPTSSAAGQLNKIRSRPTSINRTQSLTRPSPPILQTRERARSREKVASSSSSKTTTPPFRSTPIRSRPPKPDSLPSALITASPSSRMVQRTPSLTRATRTPGTPSDDGRWPSVGGRAALSMSAPKRSGSAVPDLASLKTRVNMLSLDVQKFSPTVMNPYATLPRRKKQKSVEDLTNGRNSRSSSTSRDKMTSSVIVPGKKTNSNNQYSYRESTPSKIVAPFPRSRKPAVPPKIKIYHEISIQTAITGQDVENAFSGLIPVGRVIKIDATETQTKATQSDIRDKEMENLHDKIRQLTQSKDELQVRLDDRTKKITNMELQLNKEREEKLQVQKELHLNTERVVGMLEMARGTPSEEQGYDSLLMLESQIQMSGHELSEKQEEINKLRRICRTLQNEMQRSLSAQECLMQEKANVERESNELQDFLQNEKTAMCEALKESENELQILKKRINDKDEEIKVLRDECRHLVRLNEQRRQENKTMQSKYLALENRSKDLVVQKSTAVSGASMALNGLNSRLDSLVEQLISSYNISEQDLEDVVFHNEAFTNSGSSGDGSPEYDNNINCNGSNGINGNINNELNDGSLSPQRNQSFIAAVISAIKSATTSTKKITRHKKITHNENGEESDSTEMLDSETEPCLMMDNVLEDVTMPDSHSHNMVSSSGMMISQIEIPSDIMHGDESLQNLSQAITNRQQIELQISTLAAHKINQIKQQTEQSVSEDVSCHDSVAEMPSISEYCSAQALVDQVIEVDNLVTKLLKVLRLIQMDNDNCIQQLITDKNKLQLNKEEMLEKMKDIEDINIKLRDELMDATQELMIQSNDLSSNKAEMQRHRNEIDRLNHDICNLSQLCTQSEQNDKNFHCDDFGKDDILKMLKLWREQGQLLEPDIIKYIVAALKEIPLLPEKLFGMENVCMYPHVWQDEIPLLQDAKRQYDIIDHTLDILYSVQSIVEENPCLIQLQRDLEEANFNSVTNNLPMYMAYLNGNNNNNNNSDTDECDPNNSTGNNSNYITNCTDEENITIDENEISDNLNANEETSSCSTRGNLLPNNPIDMDMVSFSYDYDNNSTSSSNKSTTTIVGN